MRTRRGTGPAPLPTVVSFVLLGGLTMGAACVQVATAPAAGQNAPREHAPAAEARRYAPGSDAQREQAPPAPSTRPAASTAPTTAPAPLDPAVDKILTRLEERDVRDLRARLVWRQQFVTELEDDAVSKIGEIWYKKSQPVAKFLIHFDSKLEGQRKDKLDERHLFDGEWYVELQSRTKTVTRRQVRRADDPVDPYRVGQGVFPLPFGQKKDEILREFDVQRVPTVEGDPPETDHLRLTPRAGTQTGESYRTLDFYIAREGPTAGLPVRVRVAKKDGTGAVNSYITITFDEARVNTGLSEGVFELPNPPGYEVINEPLEG